MYYRHNAFLHLCTLIALAICSATLFAAPSLKDYAKPESIGMMAISPNGSLVAFQKKTEDKKMLLVYSIHNTKFVTGIDIENVDPINIYFIDNETIILKAVQNRKVLGFRGNIDLSTAFKFNIADGSLDQLLVPGDVIYKGQSGLGKIISVKDNYAYMPAYVGEDKHDENPDYDLVRVDLSSPRHPKVYAKGNGSTIDYFIDNKGKVIAREDYNNKKDQYDLLAYKDGKWEKLLSEKTNIIGLSVLALQPDFNSLVALDESDKTDRVGYYTISLADGKISEAGWGTPHADIESVLTDINRVAYGVRYSGFKPSYKMFDPKVHQRVKEITESFPIDYVSLVDWSPDWKHLLFYISGNTDSGSYYLISEGKKPRFLAKNNQNIKNSDVHPIGQLAVKARDGLTIPTLVTAPASLMGSLKNLPTIMLPHGGPESYDRIDFDWITQALANEGYLVVQPQFRGSAGFGRTHRDAGHGEWGRKAQDDVTDVLNSLVKQGISDPDRVCIVGASYGGYSALAGGAFTPDLYKCVVSFAGVADLPQMMKTEKREHGSYHWVISYWEKVMSKGVRDNDFLKEISPVNHADKFKAPVLLIHGSKDDVVPPKQSAIMYKALKKAGKKVQHKVLKDETHHLINHKTRVEFLKLTTEFLKKNLH